VKIFTAQQIKAWDQFTIQHEPISSIDLMERAAQKCVDWVLANDLSDSYSIFCGKGNNGGDGLAIARMLLRNNKNVSIYILDSSSSSSDDFQQNLQLLDAIPGAEISFIQNATEFPELNEDDVIIDALFGSGLNKPLSGLAAELVNYLNDANKLIISIDVPSGLFMDQSSKGNVVIHADHTLTFQTMKLAFLMPENAAYVGRIHVLDIGLSNEFTEQHVSAFQLVDDALIGAIYKPRSAFAHKGNFGHALLIAGSYGKMGAAVLAATACLRTGVGLLSCLIPKCGYEIMQTSVPEAMVMTDEEENFLSLLPEGIEKYNAVGIGPGIGTNDATQKLLAYILRRYHKPLVIDADGLNCLSMNKEWLTSLPANSILTPHPKEFERLFGNSENDFERVQLAQQKAKELNIIIVLKGHHTFVATPGGLGYFNNTGNAGMATAGSGDVLTGVITSLAAQGYDPVQAAILGVYIHGMSGDLAAKDLSQEAMIASDIIQYLPQSFLSLIDKS
jgi:NAD(P)H-hydrate epimerase